MLDAFGNRAIRAWSQQLFQSAIRNTLRWNLFPSEEVIPRMPTYRITVVTTAVHEITGISDCTPARALDAYHMGESRVVSESTALGDPLVWGCEFCGHYIREVPRCCNDANRLPTTGARIYCRRARGHTGDHVACRVLIGDYVPDQHHVHTWPQEIATATVEIPAACECLPDGERWCAARSHLHHYICSRAPGHAGVHVACSPLTNQHFLELWI